MLSRFVIKSLKEHTYHRQSDQDCIIEKEVTLVCYCCIFFFWRKNWIKLPSSCNGTDTDKATVVAAAITKYYYHHHQQQQQQPCISRSQHDSTTNTSEKEEGNMLAQHFIPSSFCVFLKKVKMSLLFSKRSRESNNIFPGFAIFLATVQEFLLSSFPPVRMLNEI